MAKKWLDSIEKQRRRIDLKDRRSVTNIQTESTTKNSRLLAGAESILLLLSYTAYICYLRREVLWSSMSVG